MNTLLLTIYFFFFLAFNLFLTSEKGKKLFANQKKFKITVFIITFLQIIAAFLYQEVISDVFLFRGAGNHLRKRIDFYWIDSNHSQYPFFPFLIFMHAGLDWIAETIPQLEFTFLLKLVLLLPLHYLANWIKKGAKKKELGRQKYLELISSPLTYLIIFFHGQIDIILMAFFVLSFQFIDQEKINLKNIIKGAVFYAASIASKTWSMLFAPLILWFHRKNWKIILFFLLTGILLLGNVFIYTRVVFGSSVSSVLPSIFKAGGPIGVWGLTLLKPLQNLLLQHKLVSYGLMLAIGYLILIRKNLSFWKTISLFILWLYIIAIHWGIQYLIWALPFLIYFKEWFGEKWFKTFHLSAAVYTWLCYVNISMDYSFAYQNISLYLGVFVWFLIVKKFKEKAI